MNRAYITWQCLTLATGMVVNPVLNGMFVSIDGQCFYGDYWRSMLQVRREFD